MLAYLEKAKHGNLRGTHRGMPPAFDEMDAQYGTQIGEMSKHDVDAVRGTAADLHARNTQRYSIGTPDDVWAIATPDSVLGSPPQQPSRVLGATQALMQRLLPYLC